MKTLLHLPVVLSLLVLGAHFLRAGQSVLIVGVIALIFLLAVRRPWAARTVQVALLLGALEWARTGVELAIRRVEAGQPALRLVLILAAVTAVTLGSALLFQTRTLARCHGLEDRAGKP